jgi:DNA polymerase
VVLAELAGEAWRQEVFRTHGKIYEASAARVTGVPLETILGHRATTGQHHPLRKKFKILELALGYGGWTGSLKAFGAGDFMTELEMEREASAWRAASPAIVEFWGGQRRNRRPELYGIEGCWVSAITQPGVVFSYRGISHLMRGDALYCRLLSGRYLTYHRPRLTPSSRRQGEWTISYEGWNTNPKNGPVGWIRMETYGPKITENYTQATARDIQVFGLRALERAGYHIVLHVYDEDVAEVPEGWGSVEEFERIMSTMPAWASDWPIRASGGWRGKRYRKD